MFDRVLAWLTANEWRPLAIFAVTVAAITAVVFAAARADIAEQNRRVANGEESTAVRVGGSSACPIYRIENRGHVLYVASCGGLVEVHERTSDEVKP